MDELIHWTREPGPMRRPVLLMAMEGFVDAGNAASTAAMFLRHRWQADLLGTFDRDAFLDYRARRPTVTVDSGVLRRISFDELEILHASLDGPHDALFLLGPEPDMRWEEFCAAVIEVCRDLQVESVLALGAYPAAAPHTRPIGIARAHNIAGSDLVPTASDVPSYAGPVGAQVVLQHRMGEAGIPSVGVWAEVPHYISASNHPRSALALVHTIAEALHVQVDTTELQAAATLHDEQVDEAVADHPDAAEMIQALEGHIDSGGTIEQLPSGDQIAAEIERFLSDRD